MKTKKEIESKIQSLIQKELNKLYDEKLCNNFQNCKHNYKHKISGVQGRVGFCNNPCQEKKNFVCSDNETSQSCPLFENKQTKEDVKKYFYDCLADPAKAGKMFPKLAVLIWVIQEDEKEFIEENQTQEEFEEYLKGDESKIIKFFKSLGRKKK